MGIVRMVAEGIGPFESLDLDFSDGKGKPHLGPHILAGVNGSGKSTILKAVAWTLEGSASGFPSDEWAHLLHGRESRVLTEFFCPAQGRLVIARGHEGQTRERLHSWVERISPSTHDQQLWLRIGGRDDSFESQVAPGSGKYVELQDLALETSVPAAAYAPGKGISYLQRPNIGAPLPDPWKSALGFGSTISNEALQSWLLALYSKRAIAMNKSQAADSYQREIDRLERVLGLVCSGVKLDVDITQVYLQPQIHAGSKNLNFSQLSAGVRYTVGWLADFLMRQQQFRAYEKQFEKQSLLLLDEVDAHLHPQWQRKLLPGMVAALDGTETQIIVSSHSPFVISSCPEAVIHVLGVDTTGNARLERSVKAPVGTDILTTLGEIFGVESRFDVQTEADLNLWDSMKRDEAAGKLSPADRKRLSALTDDLMSRSEELRIILGFKPLPSALVDSILSKKTNGGSHSKKTAASGRRSR